MIELLLAGVIGMSNPKICQDHKIFCQIVKNNPRINKKYAFKLSNIIFKLSKKHKVNARIYTAILAQESMYKLDAKNCKKGLHKDYIKPIKVCFDFGISMINHRTVSSYNFNLNKLLNDLEYSVEAGMIVFSWFQKTYGKKEKDFWVRYNCGTKKSIDRETCQTYKKLVERYL